MNKTYTKVVYQYNKEKDLWCLANYGKGSMNSSASTQTYLKLIEQFGDNHTQENMSIFVDSFLSDNKISVKEQVAFFQDEWEKIEDIYHQKAEGIFGVVLDADVTAFLTVNNRCPYNIPDNYFFVSLITKKPNKTVMHELWHFYTWKKFGTDEVRVGKMKYNEVKESLTVLLNIIYSDILDGSEDAGYPQHKEMRDEILKMWRSGAKIEEIWNHFINI